MVCIGAPLKSRQNAIFWASMGIPESGWQDMGGTQPKDSKNLAGNRNSWECSLSLESIGRGIGTHGNAV